MSKYAILLSGGTDSATLLGKLLTEGCCKSDILAIAFNYGQKHDIELRASRLVAKYYGVEHKTLNLSNIYKDAENPLLKESNKAIPKGPYVAKQVATYIPFRNGLFISAAAAYAMSIWQDEKDIFISLGAHTDDSVGDVYADCSKTFTQYMDRAIMQGTYNVVKLFSPFAARRYTKAKIVKAGLKIGVPYHLTWSCYEGSTGQGACGKCSTCIDRLKAFHINGAQDPIKYKEVTDVSNI